MKVAIMTWVRNYNYGTSLQAFALSKYIKSLGHEPIIIDYRGFKEIRHRQSYANNIRFLIDKITKKVDKKLGHMNIYNENISVFENFVNSELNITEEKVTQSDLQALNDDIDVFIAGSDQIWSPLFYDPHYYLDFVEDANKIMAYAPSFGVSKIEDLDIQSRVKELLKRFQYLSVRENTGRILINDIAGLEAKVVLDPVFLLSADEWDLLVDKSTLTSPKKYVLIYFLGDNAKHWKATYDFAARKKLDIKIIPVQYCHLQKKGEVLSKLSPYDFLKAIRDSEYIITDSFHGTAFATIFKKQFYVFERFSKKSAINQNSRVIDLLNLFDLESRLIQYNKNVILDVDHNYETSLNRILSTVQDSRDYISTALDSIRNFTIHSDSIGNKKHILQRNTLCCGCGVCSEVCPKKAISIIEDEDGFLRARVDDSCILCGKCTKVCPFEVPHKGTPISKCSLYSYKDPDDSILSTSSSGGMAGRLAEYFYTENYNIVGCRYNQATRKAEHIIIHKDNEDHRIEDIRGSKYLQSDTCRAFHSLKNLDNIVFFGTPCQVSAARNILQNKNAIFVEIVCYGIPTYNLLNKYIAYIEKTYNLAKDNIEINFRDKKKGWRERHITISNKEQTFSVSISQNEDLYYRLFLSESCYGKQCYECRWRYSSDADIRLGDYWGPKFKEDKDGVSMVVSITERGIQALDELKCKRDVNLQSEDISDYLKAQKTENTQRPVFYEEIMRALKSQESSIEKIFAEYIVQLEHEKQRQEIIKNAYAKIKKLRR